MAWNRHDDFRLDYSLKSAIIFMHDSSLSIVFPLSELCQNDTLKRTSLSETKPINSTFRQLLDFIT